jgi:mono/diheme cytochrome c family protein
MKRKHVGRFATMVAVGMACTAAVAQNMPIDYGRAEYESNCAGCHGRSGKGDGHFRAFLNRPPSDLTTITRNNNGVFPAQRLYEVIQGSQAVPGHGAAGEMPIWGDEYRASAARDPQVGPFASEAYTRNRINLLVEYLYRIQQK